MVMEIDPAIVWGWRESRGFFINSCVFLCLLILTFALRRRIRSQNILLTYSTRISLLAINIIALAIISAQWVRYDKAFRYLDDKYPDIIRKQVVSMQWINIIFVVVTILGSVSWIGTCLGGRRGPESSIPKNMMAHFAAAYAWLQTLPSAQAMLPNASYSNMPGAELYKPTNSELNLVDLANAWCYGGLAARSAVLFASIIVANTISRLIERAKFDIDEHRILRQVQATRAYLSNIERDSPERHPSHPYDVESELQVLPPVARSWSSMSRDSTLCDYR
ncbi:uncharacterized protein CIMG_06131 [Coccidioides immitis RS]|nr:uncharacterized protein CIMG_06131 [Coccidioides immitis RS]EAS30652.3 hypothetical protein CIMG_06131 [Coccidioides immitis RS]KMP03214.1 hypothetical protein CIRG_02906 [Coccidioides immitis RMSCC 2394]TPX23578.1 hypothetical protein DIZ76_012912 [Coccidioides immitis]